MGERLPLKKKVDEKDLVLLASLIKDARISNVELARLVGLTEGAVRGRIEWLEAHRVIIGYRTLVRAGIVDAAPLHWVEFVVFPTTVEAISRFEKGLFTLPGVCEVDRLDRQSYVIRIAHAEPAQLLAALAAGAGVRLALTRARRIEVALSSDAALTPRGMAALAMED